MCSFLVSSALAVEQAVLVRDDFSREDIRLVSIAHGRVSYFGADHRLTSLDANSILRIELRKPASPPPATGTILLTDGQVLTGRLGENFSTPDSLPWMNEHLGVLNIPLDRVASFSIGDKAENSQGLDSDSVLLANGDRLIGFVDRVNAAGLTLEREGSMVELPWDNVRTVSLANLVRPTPGVWVTLTHGSRFVVDRLETVSSETHGVTLGANWTAPIRDITEIGFFARHQPIPLGELPSQIVSGGSAFGVEYPPHFDGATVTLHAPITLRFDLPRGATRFAADAAIVPGSEQTADLILIVSDDSGELFRQRLNKETPATRINLPISGPLHIELDDAEGGPVHDRLTLTNAEVLVKTE